MIINIKEIENMYNMLIGGYRKSSVDLANFVSYIRTIQEINQLPEGSVSYNGHDLSKWKIIPEFSSFIWPEKVVAVANPRAIDQVVDRDFDLIESINLIDDGQRVDYEIEAMDRIEFRNFQLEILDLYRRNDNMIAIDTLRTTKTFDNELAKYASYEGKLPAPLSSRFDLPLRMQIFEVRLMAYDLSAEREYAFESMIAGLRNKQNKGSK